MGRVRYSVCVVPTCKFRTNRSSNDRRSMFRCPKNLLMAQQWSNSIGVELKQSQYVCEHHFDPKYIRKYTEKTSDIPRSRLLGGAVPTIFNNQNVNNYDISNSYSDHSAHYLQDLQPTYNTQGQQRFCPSYNIQASQVSHRSYGQSKSKVKVSQDLYSQYNVRNPQSTTNFYNNPMTSFPTTSTDKFEVSQIELKDNTNKLPRIKNSMTDVVQDLVASQDILLNIKKEELTPEDLIVKVEPIEDFTEKFHKERKSEMQRFTVYQYVKYNKNHLISLLPESWHIFILSTASNEEIISFSKECTVNENTGLLIMYEKNIVIYKNGNVHYSIHGKRLKDINPKFLKNIPNTEILLKIIKQFDEVKVCQGLLISEFEFNSDCAIYKDDLGIKRHVKCYLMSDAQQCDTCFGYKQSLMSNVINRSQVLSDKRLPSYFKNNRNLLKV